MLTADALAGSNDGMLDLAEIEQALSGESELMKCRSPTLMKIMDELKNGSKVGASLAEFTTVMEEMTIQTYKPLFKAINFEVHPPPPPSTSLLSMH